MLARRLAATVVGRDPSVVTPATVHVHVPGRIRKTGPNRRADLCFSLTPDFDLNSDLYGRNYSFSIRLLRI